MRVSMSPNLEGRKARASKSRRHFSTGMPLVGTGVTKATCKR